MSLKRSLLEEQSFTPPVFKEGVLIAKTPAEYETALGLRYITASYFQTKKIQRHIEKLTEYGLRHGYISREQKWLGYLFDQEIKEIWTPPLSIHWIHESIGYGAFAEKPIKKYRFIGEYVGLVRKKQKKIDEENAYTFEYTVGESLETAYTIDAKTSGNYIRFLNHKEKGNCDSLLIFHENQMRIIVRSNRDIAEGEQLTYDYGSEYWERREDYQEL